MTSVKFWEHFPDGAVKCYPRAACFAPMRTGTRIRYLAVINQVPEREVEFYIQFLTNLFGDKRFTARVVNVERHSGLRGTTKGRYVLWDFKRGSLPYRKALVYLAAFRYLDEFPHFVRFIYNFRDNTLEEQFEAFQNEHNVWRACDIHHMMARYGDTPSITVDRLRENLANPDCTTCFSHFV